MLTGGPASPETVLVTELFLFNDIFRSVFALDSLEVSFETWDI